MTVTAYAHRGGADGAPENTMVAFERAVELGYTWLETDVHVTRDGVVVAFHDSRLDRVTDRSGRIAELTYADVAAADAGHGYTLDGGATYPFRGTGVTVPRLADLLNRWPGVRVNIDAKADTSVAPLIRLLHDLDAFSRVCLASFSDRRLALMRRLAGRPVLTSMGVRTVTATYLWSRVGSFPRVVASRVQVPMHPVPCASSTGGSWTPRTAPASASTCGRSTASRRCMRRSISASTGSCQTVSNCSNGC